MNKMKKLLSVVLAVVLAFSAFSVLGSAAKTAYKTVDNLNGLNAYSPYGQVTRLTTEERTSILFDFLDNTLAGANINMGEVFNVLGLSVTIDLTSVDRLCYSLDTIKSTFTNVLAQAAMGIVNLGILESLEIGTWATGMSRDGTANFTILSEVFELLSNNTNLVGKVFTDGLDLGLVSLGDMSAIENVIKDLPALVKGLVFPLLERWDDTLTEIKTLDTNGKGNGNVESTVNTFVRNLFKNDMSITTVKFNADGTMASKHTKMPIKTAAPGTPTADSPRCYYYVTGTTPGSTMKIYHIVDEKEAEALAKDTDPENDAAVYTYVEQKETYVLEEEAGNGVYVWKSTDELGNVSTLKWYDDGSRWLKDLTDSEIDSKVNLSSSSISAGDLLYTFIPYVFEEMAPVVLNGSVKKILAEFFGARFTYVGQVGEDAVAKLPDASNAFFTEEQGDYLWEWSNYAVINGNHYYRFEDQIFAGNIEHKNNYFDIINWNYKIEGSFMNDFIPSSDDSASDRLLLHVNDFLVKVAEEVLVESKETKDTLVLADGTVYTATWTRPTFAAGNANLVNNIKALAQAIIKLAPQHIFGSDYETNPRCYYSLLVSDDNDTILTGIAAQLVDIIMPSMSLPAAADIKGSNAKVGAILAAVVREFAAYLVPEYNYDALIYADFGTTTADNVKTFIANQTSEYWFDVILTMGLDVGYEYLRAFADLGEDDTATVTSAVITPGYGANGKTYAKGTTQAQLNAQWEAMLDYIIDWALSSDKEWTWRMANLVEVDGLTIDLANPNDPWPKLEKILFGLIPFDEILTIETNSTYPTRVEKFLRYDLILGIVDLRWDALINTIQFNGPQNYFRTGNILDQLAKLLKNIVNGIFDKVGGGSYALIPAAITDFDSLANQANLVEMVKGLVGVLYKAFITNGLAATALPILNLFIGWKMDPQVFADPLITLSYENNMTYMYTGGDSAATVTMDITNMASGMLEKHRDSSVVDSPYTIKVTNVTSDDVTVSGATGLNTVINPGEKGQVTFNAAYTTDKAVTFVVSYEFTGKDGQPVGGTQEMTVQSYISNKFADGEVTWDYVDKETGGNYWVTNNHIKIRREAYKPYYFINNLNQIEVIGYPFNNASDGKNVYVATGRYTSNTASAPFSMFATSNWVHGSSENKSLNPQGAMKHSEASDTDKSQFWTLYPYIYDETSTAEVTPGTKLNLPTLSYIGFRNSNGKSVDFSQEEGRTDLTMEIYYYDITELEKVYADVDDIQRDDFNVSDSVWNTFKAARDAAVEIIMAPKMRNTFTTVYSVSNVTAKAEALAAAYEALKEAHVDDEQTTDLPDYVQELLAKLEEDDKPKNGFEINFQDYQYYEYFSYADIRTEARNLYASYLAPEIMDTYYILNSGIREAELNDVIANEANATKAAAITATRLENDAAAIQATVDAYNNWRMPTHSKLYVEDMAARLVYYRQFLANHRENDDHLYFLEQEIKHVEAQQMNPSDYEEVTWGRYAEALDVAKKVLAGNDPEGYGDYNSRIYDVKYNLMVTYKQLLKKADSLILNGTPGIKELEANIVIAEEILAKSMDELELSQVAIDKGLTKEQALGHLIQGLGYYYVGEDGNTWNLYADSAYEYADNDRPNKTGNQAKVNACNDNLEACIAYFSMGPSGPNALAFKDGFADAGIFVDTEIGAIIQEWYEYAMECEDAEATGFIYGLDTIGYDDLFESEYYTQLEDAFTTVYGDDYLRITTPEDAEGFEATGTIVEVLDADGETVVETYYFVYFGDVNFDGYVDGLDSTEIGKFDYYQDTLPSIASIIAADFNGDTYMDGADGSDISKADYYGEGYAIQTEVAAMFYETMYGF